MYPEVTFGRAASRGSVRVEHGPTAMVVFSDVDGALRDAGTRSWADAHAALRLLDAHRVPLVLWSDLCAAELLPLQRDLGIRQPFICESGAALYIPQDYFTDLAGLGAQAGDWEVIAFGEPREVVCGALYQVADTLGMAIDGLGRPLEGPPGPLSALDAPARQRVYDEPFLLPGSDGPARARLFSAMRHAGFRCFTAPQCHHATGVQDPAHAVRLLISLYRLHGDRVLVVGLGDDWTDRVLLREVDVPVVVRNRHVDQRRLLRKVPGAYVTAATGPAGWSEAILGSLAG